MHTLRQTENPRQKVLLKHIEINQLNLLFESDGVRGRSFQDRGKGGNSPLRGAMANDAEYFLKGGGVLKK